MPPRKSNVSTTSAGDDPKDGMSVEDFNLPKTMVQRLAKGVLPANTQIQKDAVLAISKSATVFVNYLASHAMENAARQNKKTIQPKDVLDALHELEFDGFIPRCAAELDKYNSVQCDKRNSYRRKIKEDAKAKEALEGSQTQNALQDGQVDSDDRVQVVIDKTSSRRDEEPASKKARKDGEDVEDDEDDEDTFEEAAEQQEEEEEEEDDDDDDEDVEDAEEEGGQATDQLMEDPLEERQKDGGDEDDDVLDGDESE